MADLVTRLGIEQDPANFDDLSTVSGDVDRMLIAGSSDVYDDISIEIWTGLRLSSSHDLNW